MRKHAVNAMQYLCKHSFAGVPCSLKHASAGLPTSHFRKFVTVMIVYAYCIVCVISYQRAGRGIIDKLSAIE